MEKAKPNFNIETIDDIKSYIDNISLKKATFSGVDKSDAQEKINRVHEMHKSYLEKMQVEHNGLLEKFNVALRQQLAQVDAQKKNSKKLAEDLIAAQKQVEENTKRQLQYQEAIRLLREETKKIDIQSQLNATLQTKLEDLQAQLLAAQEEATDAAQMLSELQSLQQHSLSIEEENRELAKENQAHFAEMSDLREQILTLQEDKIRLEEALHILEEENKKNQNIYLQQQKLESEIEDFKLQIDFVIQEKKEVEHQLQIALEEKATLMEDKIQAIAEANTRHQSAIDQLNQERDHLFEQLKVANQRASESKEEELTSLLAQKEEEFQALIQQKEAQNEANLERVNAQFRSEIDVLKEAINIKASEIQSKQDSLQFEEFTKEKDALTEAVMASRLELEALKEQLQQEKGKNSILENQAFETLEDLEVAKNQLEIKINELEKLSLKSLELDSLENMHREAIQELQRQHQAEYLALELAKQQEIETLKDAFAVEKNQIEETHANAIAQLRAEKDLELEQLKTQQELIIEQRLEKKVARFQEELSGKEVYIQTVIAEHKHQLEQIHQEIQQEQQEKQQKIDQLASENQKMKIELMDSKGISERLQAEEHRIVQELAELQAVLENTTIKLEDESNQKAYLKKAHQNLEEEQANLLDRVEASKAFASDLDVARQDLLEQAALNKNLKIEADALQLDKNRLLDSLTEEKQLSSRQQEQYKQSVDILRTQNATLEEEINTLKHQSHQEINKIQQLECNVTVLQSDKEYLENLVERKNQEINEHSKNMENIGMILREARIEAERIVEKSRAEAETEKFRMRAAFRQEEEDHRRWQESILEEKRVLSESVAKLQNEFQSIIRNISNMNDKFMYDNPIKTLDDSGDGIRRPDILDIYRFKDN